jgi:hypothetical protein
MLVPRVPVLWVVQMMGLLWLVFAQTSNRWLDASGA